MDTTTSSDGNGLERDGKERNICCNVSVNDGDANTGGDIQET